RPTGSSAKPAPSQAAQVTADQKPAETASAEEAAPLRDAYHTAPLDTVDGKTYQGWKYYNLNCARCHGEDVAGTTIAPHLIMSLKPDGPINTKELFIQTVCEGRVPKGMPAWCQTGMTPAEIDTIYAYVKGRSDAKLHPGRPARSPG
ncbi:MAG TPA: cytochrome c, partial [Gemmatimonadales bacterium]|nr:cytochrome c [Gemmatimonadales bacterium]